MNTRYLLLSGITALLLSSCEGFLDPLPSGIVDEKVLWEDQSYVQGLIGWAYDNLPKNYDNNESAMLDGVTDNAVITNSIHALNRYSDGTLPAGLDPFAAYWTRNYNAIRNVNIFLKDNKGLNYKYMLNSHFNDLVRFRLHGEAYAIRAWFQWDLLQKFGGRGINGEMLGFPIVTEPIEDVELADLERNTYDECVRQILADCDSAYKYLPIAHRDFLVSNQTDLVYSGGKYWGRFDGITTRAIKSMVYLTWASPRFNSGNDVSRWDSAATNALEVMNFKLNIDGVQGRFNPSQKILWTNPNFAGIIWSSRYSNNNDNMERLFYPGGFQGTGVIGASHELAEAFSMKNGYPITDPRSMYDPSKPYDNRDPRFYSNIFHNDAKARSYDVGAVMYSFENWVNGGKDAPGVKSTNTLTGYYIKKYVFMGLNWSDATINAQPHSKFFIRWAHMCLNFAEAANHVVGPNDETRYGLSAKTAIQYLRSRTTPEGKNGISPKPPLSPDPYLTEVANEGVESFNELVKNERRIETCFEGMRFFDLVRWSTTLNDLNIIVHGAYITKEDNDSFSYDFTHEVKKRTLPSAYLPIPYSEMLKMDKLIQNEGWEKWR